MRERPNNFALKCDHSLAKGLVFAGLGRAPGSVSYRDSAPYDNHGTLTGMVPADDWLWIPELGRWGLDFNRTANERVELNKTYQLNENQPWTLSFWIYRRTRTYFDHICADILSDNINRFTGSAADPFSIVSRDNDNIGTSWTTATFATYKWYACSLVCNGEASNNHIGYVNGNWNKTSTTTGSHYLITLIPNRANSFAYRWDGFIVDFMIHSRALSLPEIQQLADPSNALLSGLILPPKRKYYVIKPTTTTTYKYLILKQNNKFLSFRKF